MQSKINLCAALACKGARDHKERTVVGISGGISGGKHGQICMLLYCIGFEHWKPLNDVQLFQCVYTCALQCWVFMAQYLHAKPETLVCVHVPIGVIFSGCSTC